MGGSAQLTGPHGSGASGHVVERIPTGEQYSIMFAKDSPLVAEATKAITEMKTNGFLAQLHEKWFGTKPDATTSTVKIADAPKL